MGLPPPVISMNTPLGMQAETAPGSPIHPVLTHWRVGQSDPVMAPFPPSISMVTGPLCMSVSEERLTVSSPWASTILKPVGSPPLSGPEEAQIKAVIEIMSRIIRSPGLNIPGNDIGEVLSEEFSGLVKQGKGCGGGIHPVSREIP